MSTMIDLDNVMLSEETVVAWSATVSRIARAIITAGIEREEDIPLEQARIEDDGTLTIFIALPSDVGEVSMSVPAGHWTRRQ